MMPIGIQFNPLNYCLIQYQQFSMNLSLVFLVLIAFVVFLLYDMFKKSRQQQELAQAQKSSQTLTSSQSRLKPNYQTQCALLHQLHEEKIVSLKHKNVSIHLREEEETEGWTPQRETQIAMIIKTLLQTHNVYLLLCRKRLLKSQLAMAVRKGGATVLGFDTNDGAVAVLRQLNCGAHLEGDLPLYNILVQYLPAVWVSNPQKLDAPFGFKSQLQMVVNLELSLRKSKEMKEE